jgi:hypothetical protein
MSSACLVSQGIANSVLNLYEVCTAGGIEGMEGGMSDEGVLSMTGAGEPLVFGECPELDAARVVGPDNSAAVRSIILAN